MGRREMKTQNSKWSATAESKTITRPQRRPWKYSSPSDAEQKNTRNSRDSKTTRNGEIQSNQPPQRRAKTNDLTPDSARLRRYAKKTMSLIMEGIIFKALKEQNRLIDINSKCCKTFQKIHRPKVTRLKPGRKPTCSK